MTTQYSEEQLEIINQIKLILDPDVGIDIWTMGLIYTIDIINDETVSITMTFTTPFCPAAPMLQEQIREQLENLGYLHIDIKTTFDPPWKCPEDLRVMLGI